MAFSNYRKYRPLVHIAVWVIYFVVTLLPPILSGGAGKTAYYIIHLMVLVGATYLNAFFLIDKYFKKDNYTKYVISVMILMLLCMVSLFFSGNLLPYPVGSFKYYKVSIAGALAFAMEFSLLAMYKAAKEWYLRSKRSKELELEKMQAELTLLRSQLDAHFIFNTLNNLYLLVLKKSDKAPEAILTLSDLLSYIIYDSKKSKVSLEKELTFLKGYIELQKLRLPDAQNVYFNVEGNNEGEIVPLILFNFIENAFKHYKSNIQKGGEYYVVYINVVLADGTLTMTVKNAFSKEIHKEEGIGLYNAKKRLDLTYHDNYSLNVNTEKGIYSVELVLKTLSSND